MILAGGLALALWALAGQGEVTLAASDELSSARSLYAAGNYEEALARLAEVKADGAADEVDQYRALCLLALGRSKESEQSLQELVARRPHFKMSDTDVSPRLLEMFRTVRRRLLPTVAKNLYASAKVSFEQKRFAEASTQLRDLLELLGDEDMTASSESMGDLKLIAQGFQQLSDLQVVAEEKAAAEAAAARARAAQTAAAANAPPPAPAARPYSDVDEGIVPPVAISRSMPPWRPVTPTTGMRAVQGHLRVIIDEEGRVESASLLRPFLAGYDEQLLKAAMLWTFRPATKDGVRVKYLKLFTIDVAP